jgi:hypothetical protein
MENKTKFQQNQMKKSEHPLSSHAPVLAGVSQVSEQE